MHLKGLSMNREAELQRYPKNNQEQTLLQLKKRKRIFCSPIDALL